MTEIYGAGEENPEGIDSGLLEDAILRRGQVPVVRVPQADVVGYLMDQASENETVAFLGAGDITEVADDFVEALREQIPAEIG